MKKIFTILTFLSATSIFAIDRFVDPNLSAGNGTTLFTNITSAVAAAVNGDRIIVASNTYNEATLTINKSLKIIPQTAGATINFNANIVVAGFPGMKLEIIGFNLGIYSFSSSAITTGSYSNRAKISIIECTSVNVEFNNDFYELNLLKSNINSDLNFKYGNIVSNIITNCYLWDEGMSNQNTNNKILIVANTILNETQLLNDDFKFMLANNQLNNLKIQKWVFDISSRNLIINNNFVNNCKLHFAMVEGGGGQCSDPNCYVNYYHLQSYNFKISNNKFLGSTYFSNRGTFSTNLDKNFASFFYGANYYDTLGFGLPIYSSTISQWPNTSSGGFFEWSYNSIPLPNPNTGVLVYTNISGPTNDIDGGNPNHDYYDIDLTINDRGINGGPYSQLNYNPTSNPNNSKAFIFDLEMPTDLFPGQSVNIKAAGYHKN